LLDHEEFACLVAELEATEITAEELHVWFTKIDINSDGYIDFEEFITWWSRLQEIRSSHL
jgi:Ca2+-binding EF-hand superfamily protein